MSAVPASLPGSPSRLHALLTWAAVLTNAARLVAYLPTLQAISASDDAAGQSLLTWLVWTFSNVSMALWLYEGNARRVDRIVALNICNTLLCTLTTLLVFSRQHLI